MTNPTTKELVENLRGCVFDVGQACDKYAATGKMTCSCSAELMLIAADRLEELSKLKAQPRWIPVTERLPEESGKYLVRYLFGTEILWYEILKTKGKWMTKCKNVTHWMPLPEPPKEE